MKSQNVDFDSRFTPSQLSSFLSLLSFLFLQLMISGLGKIDIEDWKAHTRLKHCSADTNIVKWFWRAVTEYDEERRARLLQFVTGSSRVPLQGFKALQGTPSVLPLKCV